MILVLLGTLHSLHQSLIIRTKMFENFCEDNTTSSDDMIEQFEKARNQLQKTMNPIQQFESASVFDALKTLICPGDWRNTHSINSNMEIMKRETFPKSSNVANGASDFSETITALIRCTVYFVFYAIFRRL